MGNWIKFLPEEQRASLLKEAYFTMIILPEQALAVKADRKIH